MRHYKRLEEKAAQLEAVLLKLYPESRCALEYDGDAWRLLVMGILSAQCTDVRVNEVSRELFSAYPTVFDMAIADVTEVERIIRPCGLFRAKAGNIRASAVLICETFGGNVPDTMEDLLTLPGVGRKIANLVLGDVFNKGGIVADTHCIRICGRLGFYPDDKKDPVLCERTMEQYVERSNQSDLCHRLVNFGRDRCRARGPLCDGCPAAFLCDSAIKTKKIKNC